jgi:hypothetical protein
MRVEIWQQVVSIAYTTCTKQCTQISVSSHLHCGHISAAIAICHKTATQYHSHDLVPTTSSGCPFLSLFNTRSSGVHQISYLMGTGVSFPGVKRSGREDDHSPPSSTEVKNKWSYTSAVTYAFMTCTGTACTGSHVWSLFGVTTSSSAGSQTIFMAANSCESFKSKAVSYFLLLCQIRCPVLITSSPASHQ